MQSSIQENIHKSELLFLSAYYFMRRWFGIFEVEEDSEEFLQSESAESPNVSEKSSQKIARRRKYKKGIFASSYDNEKF